MASAPYRFFFRSVLSALICGLFFWCSLGIINAENDAVYLPLKKGSNELMLAVSELGGGWGFVCRLADLGN